MKNTMEKLKQEARDSWTGQIGEERANKLEAYLNKKLAEYSLALNIPQEDILDAWERNRTYSAINYYQEANQPEIKSEKVRIFETAADLFRVVKSKQFRCPACKGISTSPYKCDSGIRKNNKSCDWNVDGLFGDLGEGIHVFCKDKMLGNTIFMPLSWENEI